MHSVEFKKLGIMAEINFAAIERKWQSRWEKEKAFAVDENSKKIIIDSILDVINFINELEKLNEQIIVKLRQLIKEELEKYKLLNEMSQPLIQFIGQIENLSRTQVMMKLYELVKNGKIRQSEFMIAVNEVISQLLKK